MGIAQRTILVHLARHRDTVPLIIVSRYNDVLIGTDCVNVRIGKILKKAQIRPEHHQIADACLIHLLQIGDGNVAPVADETQRHINLGELLCIINEPDHLPGLYDVGYRSRRMEICQWQSIFLPDDIIGVYLTQCRVILGMSPLYDGNTLGLRVDIRRVIAEVDISGADVPGKP